MSEVPQKDYYRLSEVCQYTDTQPYVLRFWESEFPQLGHEAAPDGRKLYRRADIELVHRIKHLLYEEECTLAEARTKLEQEQRVRHPAKPPAATAPRPAAPAGPSRNTPARAEREVAERRIASALPPREIPSSPPPSEIDVVARDRYEAAIEEIDHLRMQLKDAERARRKHEHAAAEAEARLGRERERRERAAARLEQLLAGLDGPSA